MNQETQSPREGTEGRDDESSSNRSNQPAQGESGRREDEARESGSRIGGPGFGKGSNAV